MSKKIECPNCKHKFTTDTLKHRQCRKCKKWKNVDKFYFGRAICVKCQGHIKLYTKSTTRRRARNGDLLKLCRRCNKWKSEISFKPYKGPTDKLRPWCTDCNQAYHQQYDKARRKK